VRLLPIKFAAANRLGTICGLLCCLIIFWPASFQQVPARVGISLDSAIYPTSEGATQPQESVRAELARTQKQTGLTLASYGNGIQLVLFEKRQLLQSTLPWSVAVGTSPSRLPGFGSLWGTISRDGTEIAAAHYTSGQGLLLELELLPSDGSSLREYPDVHPQDICWSYDKSKLALTVHKGSPDAALQVMDLGSNVTEDIDPRAKLTSQCWSPDDKKIVYEADDSVRVYEVEKGKSRALVLGIGKYPTWSPDGNWIAFLHHGAYYAIRPNGQERKKLFHRSGTESPLYWSPDSRIVAFVSPEGFFEGGWRAIDADNYKLRVRRLDDNSEDWIAYVDGARSYQWVTNPQLLKQVESGTTTRQPPEESRRKVLTDKSSRGGLPHVRAVDVLAGIHQR
jgi:hypothetical protein